jgi:hypothetical protein
MFYIVDLRENPPIRVSNIEFETYNECIDWINENGSIIIYTIEEQQI